VAQTRLERAAAPLARLYYRFYNRTVVGGKHHCVAVKVRREDAFIVTAYLTDRVKKGTVLWPKE
jgi:ferredoxin-NADP reductase